MRGKVTNNLVGVESEVHAFFDSSDENVKEMAVGMLALIAATVPGYPRTSKYRLVRYPL
jgi:hypothetical protein